MAEDAGSDSLSRVTGASPRGGDIVQTNCVVRKFTLQIEHSEQLFVVLKQVNLAENRCVPGTLKPFRNSCRARDVDTSTAR